MYWYRLQIKWAYEKMFVIVTEFNWIFAIISIFKCINSCVYSSNNLAYTGVGIWICMIWLPALFRCNAISHLQHFASHIVFVIEYILWNDRGPQSWETECPPFEASSWELVKGQTGKTQFFLLWAVYFWIGYSARVNFLFLCCSCQRPPLWSSGQSSSLQIQGSQVRFPGTTKN
jgi:hypothetical protein